VVLVLVTALVAGRLRTAEADEAADEGAAETVAA
jgi:hypothetical protein